MTPTSSAGGPGGGAGGAAGCCMRAARTSVITSISLVRPDPNLPVQKFPRLVPAVQLEAHHPPQHRERLEQSCALDPTDIAHGRPAEFLADLRDRLLCRGVVARDEHIGWSARQLGLHEQREPDDV